MSIRRKKQIMLKSCQYCGKIHDSKYMCPHKPQIKKKRTEEDKFRQTREWTNKSTEIKELHNYLCAVCKDNGIYTYNGLETHHIEKLNDRYDLRLDNENLIPLCITHHKQADKGEIDKEYLKDLILKQRK